MNPPALKDCPFCFLINKTLPDIPISLQVEGYKQLNQKLIYKGSGLNVKPDVSPITKNHFLIIPINHYFSSQVLPPSETEELALVKKKIESFYLTEMRKDTIFFEHGSCTDSKGSSCVHHAHIHSVPIDKIDSANIINYAIRILGTPRTVNEVDINNYLYLEPADSPPLFWNDSRGESQVFRRIISEILGSYDRSSWQGCILYTEQREISRKWLLESSSINL